MTKAPGRGVLRWVLRGLLAMLLLPVVLLTGLVGWATTEDGGRRIAALLSDVAGPALRVDGVSIDPAGRVSMAGIALADPDGVWATVDRVDMSWSWWPLLDRRLAIDGVTVGTISLSRTPAAAENGTADGRPPPSDSPFAFPRLPGDVTLARLTVERLDLGERVAGVPAALAIEATGSLDRAGAAALDLRAERLDGPTATMVLAAAADIPARRLDIDLLAEEGPGGLLAALADRPDLPGLSIRLAGDGDLDGWIGDLHIVAGEARLEGTVTLAGPAPWRAGLTGAARPGDMLAPEARSLVGDRVALDLSVSYTPDGHVTAERIAIGIANASLSGAAGLTANGGVDGIVHVSLTPTETLQALAAPAEIGPGQFEISITGDLAAPRVRIAGQLDRLATPEATIAPLPIDIEIAAAAPYDRIGYALSSAAIGLRPTDPALAQLAGDRVDLSVGGTIDLARGFVAVDAIDLVSGPLAVAGNGGLDFAGSAEAVLTVRHDALDRFSDLAGAPVRGRSDLVVIARREATGGIDVTVDAVAEGLAAGPPDIAPLLGERPAIFVQARSDPDLATITLDRLALETTAARLEGAGVVGLARESLSLDWSISVPDAAAFAAVAGTPIGGRLDARGRIEGALSDPDVTARVTAPLLTLREERLRDVVLSAEARRVVSAPVASLRLDAATDRGAVSVRGAAREAAGTLVVENLELTRGGTDRVGADLTIDPRSGTAAGTIRIDVPDLKGLGELLGEALSGRLGGTIELSAPGGRQQAELDLRLDRLGHGVDADATRVESLRLRGTAADLINKPVLDLRLDVAGAEAGSARIHTLAATARGPLDRVAITADLDGEAMEPTRLALAATVGLTSAERSVEVTRLTAAWGPVDARLRAPTTLRMSRADLSLQPVDLEIAGGTIRLTGTRRGDTVAANLLIDGVPLDRLAALSPDLDLIGVLSADGTLSGTLADPGISLRVALRDVQGRERELARLPPVNLTADLRIGGGTATLDAAASGFSDHPLALSAGLPIALSLDPPRISLAPTAPVAGRLAWSGSIGDMLKYLPVDSVMIEGDVEARFDLAGTVDRPDLSGSLRLDRGRYENRVVGTRLEPFTIDLSGAGRRIDIAFEGTTPEDGTVALAGSLDLETLDMPTLDLTLTARDAEIVARDDVTARSGADVTVRGSLDGMLIAGRIEPSLVEVRLIDNLPPSVVELDVVDAAAPAPEPDDAPDLAEAIALDLTIDIPRRVFVRGRGLDSEWAGGFHITGTAAAPLIEGSIGPVRGGFLFAGKRFDLREGGVSFAPGSREPLLDLAAATTENDITAIVRIRGRPSEPTIRFESVPPLPEDEVLSQVLFGKGSGRLTAAESLQLAQALTELSSGETGVMDMARATLGLDELSFGAGDGDGIGTVRAGRYLRDDVFVGVEQGASAASTKATVEVELTETIKLQSSVGADSRSSVGVEWELDY